MMALTLAMILTFSLSVPALAADKTSLKSDVNSAAFYIYKTVADPQVGSVGGEWAVLGLARSGFDVPNEYFQKYYATLEAYVKAGKGVLHEKKYTDYSRVIVALTAIGKDPSNVSGYNLLSPLGDFDKTVWQGINGPIWALIALDSGNYAMPQNPTAATQATRQMYIDKILASQLADGGWSLSGLGGGTTPADPDITGVALQALANYQSKDAVKAATTKALACLSKVQLADGGFASGDNHNSESTVQVIVALCELGISMDDSRFVKNGHTPLDNLLSYKKGDGSFLHTSAGSGSNQMASEQGLYGIVAALRAAKGQNSLYRMSDAISIGSNTGTDLGKGEGLVGKNKDVKAVSISAPGTTFNDIKSNKSITAIEALAARGIITGMSKDLFAPQKTMTRAEFATIMVRGLSLSPKAVTVFTDVSSSSWYAGYVGTANTYGIVTGVAPNKFDPNSTITRQEAATMVARAAKLCGMDTGMGPAEVRDILAQFGDYTKSADWARPSLAFCYKENILDASVLNIEPITPVLRSEIAEMIFRMLGRANLI